MVEAVDGVDFAARVALYGREEGKSYPETPTERVEIRRNHLVAFDAEESRVQRRRGGPPREERP